MQLDKPDRQILAAVQEDATLSFAAIGKRVHLSPSAVLRRLARLKRAGVITGSHMAVDPKRAGWPITLVLELTLECERADLLDEVKRSFAAAPEVQHCFYVTGDVDIIAILILPSLEEYEGFTRRMILGNANIKKFRTSVVMDRIKSGMTVPV